MLLHLNENKSTFSIKQYTRATIFRAGLCSRKEKFCSSGKCEGSEKIL